MEKFTLPTVATAMEEMLTIGRSTLDASIAKSSVVHGGSFVLAPYLYDVGLAPSTHDISGISGPKISMMTIVMVKMAVLDASGEDEVTIASHVDGYFVPAAGTRSHRECISYFQERVLVAIDYLSEDIKQNATLIGID